MTIIEYFFPLLPGEYTVPNSDSTPFCLEDINFSCGPSIFVATATEANLKAATFVTITFTAHKNCVRGYKIGHKVSGESLL